IPGGQVILPQALINYQSDMEGATIACVAPFKIDATEVTNQDYLAFWNSLPEKERKSNGLSYFPVSWSTTFPFFSGDVGNLPVLGVPLIGAQEYARWKCKRLPTPYEWCRAAFG